MSDTYDDFEEWVLDRRSNHANVEEKDWKLREIKTVWYSRANEKASPFKKLNELVYKNDE